MTGVKAKKSLGQHFLNDENIACKIIDCILKDLTTNNILEVGPGMGVLTKYLNQHEHLNITVVEIDPDFVKYLKNKFLDQNIHIIGNDFLKIDLHKIWQEDMAIVGNFPYNISSQILFKVLDHVDIVDSLVGMFQKEVAVRICSGPGTKKYGILSVLIQAYYHVEYLFTIPPEVFSPPPKVLSGVIKLKRKKMAALNCDEKLFRTVVKTGFSHRRKTLRNSLKPLIPPDVNYKHPVFSKRAEQLSVQDFVELTNMMDKS